MNQELIDLIAAAIGGIFSLVFEFFPVVKTWFEALTKFQKQMVFGGLAVIAGAGIFGLNCAGLWAMIFPTLPLLCTVDGALSMLQIVIAVIGGAQATHITLNRLLHLVSGK